MSLGMKNLRGRIALHNATKRASVEQLVHVNRSFGSGRSAANQAGGPRESKYINGQLEHLRESSDFEHKIHPLASDLHDARTGIFVLPVDNMGRPQLCGQCQPHRADVNRDDWVGPCYARRHHRRQPDAASAKDCDACTRRNSQ